MTLDNGKNFFCYPVLCKGQQNQKRRNSSHRGFADRKRGKVVFLHKQKVCVQNWDKTRQLVRGNSEESKSINKFLSAVKAKIYQKEAELIDRGFVITAELLRDAYFDKVESLKEHSLMSVLEAHNAQCRSMVGTQRTRKVYLYEPREDVDIEILYLPEFKRRDRKKRD